LHAVHSAGALVTSDRYFYFSLCDKRENWNARKSNLLKMTELIKFKSSLSDSSPRELNHHARLPFHRNRGAGRDRQEGHHSKSSSMQMKVPRGGDGTVKKPKMA
jgi:hypothetical protein